MNICERVNGVCKVSVLSRGRACAARGRVIAVSIGMSVSQSVSMSVDTKISSLAEIRMLTAFYKLKMRTTPMYRTNESCTKL